MTDSFCLVVTFLDKEFTVLTTLAKNQSRWICICEINSSAGAHVSKSDALGVSIPFCRRDEVKLLNYSVINKTLFKATEILTRTANDLNKYIHSSTRLNLLKKPFRLITLEVRDAIFINSNICRKWSRYLKCITFV